MPQGDSTGSTRAGSTDVQSGGADVVAELLGADQPACLDVRAGGRRLRLWAAANLLGTDDAAVADVLALVLTLAPGTFQYTIAPDVLASLTRIFLWLCLLGVSVAIIVNLVRLARRL